MDRELAAIARSRRSGGCAGTRYGTVDLASDALAYARGHGRRLSAPETERWAGAFFGPKQGLHPDLDALEARVIAVRDAIVEGSRLAAHRAGRWDYAAQDIGYRLLLVRAGLADARGEALDSLIDRLAGDRSERGMLAAVHAYEQLVRERPARRGARLPSASALFAVGYPLVAGHGSSLEQLAQGVSSACPSTASALGKQLGKVVAAFAASDAPERTAIGRRFAVWLATTRSDGLADLARLEAAICHAARPSELDQTLPADEARDDRWRLSEHAELVPITHAVAGSAPAEITRLPAEPARWLAVVRDAEDVVDVLDLPWAVGEALHESLAHPRPAGGFALSPDDAAELIRAGLLMPAAYTCGDLA